MLATAHRMAGFLKLLCMWNDEISVCLYMCVCVFVRILRLFVCVCLCTCVCVCVCLSVCANVCSHTRLIITSVWYAYTDLIWFINKLQLINSYNSQYHYYCRGGLTNDIWCTLHKPTNTSKVLLYTVNHYFTLTVVFNSCMWTSNKMEHFHYKGGCGVSGSIEAFKRTAGFDYWLTSSGYYYLLAIYSYLTYIPLNN